MGALPPGLHVRPLTLEDARAVYELMADQEAHDVGEPEVTYADIVTDWQRPSFDVVSSTVGVFDSGRLVAYAEVTGPQRADAAVHPDHRRRGIGTALSRWVRETARARGDRIVGSPVPQGSDGDRLLASLGYGVRWESWILELPPGAEIEPQPLPRGYEIRTAQSEADHRAAWDVVEEAFSEWNQRERQPFEDFATEIFQRPGFEPWHLRLAVAPDGQVVGACHLVHERTAPEVAFVQSIGVRRDQRGRGLARALLVDAFGNARRAGAARSELNTDTRTGALGLYEHVGMRVRATWLHRAVEL